MENKIEIFNNDNFGELRIITEGETTLFCASDVAKALGYTNPNKAVRDHCRAITKRSSPISGKNQEINFIPEGDVYRLIVRSKLPAAEAFETWVFDEVLPDIRKHGVYMTNDLVEQFMSDPEAIGKMMLAYAEEKKKNKELTTENTELKETVMYKENVIVGLTKDIDLATKRSRIYQIVNRSIKNQDKRIKRWALLYSEFEKKYHVNLSLRLSNHRSKFTPKLKNKMNVIDRELNMIPETYEICCKLFESDVDELMKEWESTVVK